MQYTIKNDQFRKAIEKIIERGVQDIKFMIRKKEFYIFIEEKEEIKLDLYSELKHTYKCTIHGVVLTLWLEEIYDYIIKEEDNTSPIYLEIDIQSPDNSIYIIDNKTGKKQYESEAYLHIKQVNHIQNNDNKYTITTEDIRKPVIIEKMANYILGGYTDEEIESGEGIEELYRDIAKQYDEILYYNIKANMFEAKGELRDDIERKLIEMSGETDDDGTFLYPELRKDVYNTEEGWVVDVDDLLEWAEIKEIDTYLYV